MKLSGSFESGGLTLQQQLKPIDTSTTIYKRIKKNGDVAQCLIISYVGRGKMRYFPHDYTNIDTSGYIKVDTAKEMAKIIFKHKDLGFVLSMNN